jgi:hypothetical protein
MPHAAELLDNVRAIVILRITRMITAVRVR